MRQALCWTPWAHCTFEKAHRESAERNLRTNQPSTGTASAQPKQTDHPHVLAVRGAVHGETGVSATHLLRVEEDICLLTLPRDLRVQAELGRS